MNSTIASHPDRDRRDVLPLLTILMLLLCSPQVWYLQAPLVITCAAGLAVRRWLWAPPFWYILTSFLAIAIWWNWESTDNHKYMMCYWCLAICCTLTLPNAQRRPAQALSARMLIGLCMLFSVIWKIANPQYLDGSFFEFTLLTDDRFQRMTSLVTDFQSADLAANRQLAQMLTEGYLFGLPIPAVTLTGTVHIQRLAQMLTWWTVAIESLLAVSFLLPNRGRRIAWVRNLALLVFAATTYSVATVRGFGWILMLLGIAQCDDRRDKPFRIAYVAVFLLIQAYMIPVRAIWGVLTG